MTLSEETVRHIALLSRLGLESTEVKQMQKDLSEVLGFFQQLEKLPAETVSVAEIEGAVSGARTDRSERVEEDTTDIITKNFPATKDNFLKVRSVF